MNRVLKNIIFGAITAMIMATAAFATQNVNVSFVPSSASWQRNSIVTVSVVLTATDEAVSMAGVELHFNYDSAKFKALPTIIADNINSNLFVNDVDATSANRVIYRKAMNALGSPTYITLTPGVPFTAYTLRFRVTSVNAQEGLTSFNFDTIIDVVSNRAGQSVCGSLTAGSYTIVPDTTPPIIVAAPTSTTMNTSTYGTISLAVSGADLSGDLQYIKYTIDGSDPKGAGGITYTTPITIPQNAFTTLQYYGRDIDNNDSSTSTQTYTVDTIYPAFSALSSTPNIGKMGTTVTVDFTANEPLQSAPQVRVAGIIASGVDTTYPTYTYRYTLTGSESQGTQNISIQMTDLAGNTTTNTTQKVLVDFKVPTYDPISMSPVPAIVGQPVVMVFRASERLSTLTTVNIMGRNSTRTSETPSVNGAYVYTYTSDVINGTERTALITVHGVDLAGNSSNSNDNWGNITATGRDVYSNEGSSTANVGLDYTE